MAESRATEHGAEPFLSRWSRLKRSQPEPPAHEPARVAPPPVPQPEARALTDADMPPLDELGRDSDFSLFLSPGVSDDLRSQALSKLFAQPEFNLRDGLDDYDDDFTRFDSLGDMVTYQMRQWAEREARERILADAPAEDAGSPAVSPDGAPAAEGAGPASPVADAA